MTTPPQPDYRLQLHQALIEVLGLRQQVASAVPAPGASMDTIQRALLEIRGHLDRLETLYSWAIGVAGWARRNSKALADVAEDAYDAHSQRLRRTGREEYSSGRERQADASLASYEQKHEARQAWHLKDEAADVVQQIELAYRFADGARYDLGKILGHAAWESHLER